MTMDRWGDNTHRMSAYNNCHQPSSRDQRQIDRMERETMVLYPTLPPNPVLPMRSPGFSGGRGLFLRGTGGIRGLNWRAEGLRALPPRNGLACLQPECEQCISTSAAFYRQQREVAPFVTRRKYNRKSPSGGPHRKVPYYPRSPSTSLSQPQRMKLNRFLQQGENTQTPHQLPSPGMNLPALTKKKLVSKKTVQVIPLPQRQWG